MNSYLRTCSALALLALGLGSAQAAVFFVNTQAQGSDASPGDGVCETGNGNGICTFEAAVQESNGTVNIVDDIVFSVSGTFNRGGSVRPQCISASVRINGPSTARVVLDGGGTQRPLCVAQNTSNTNEVMVEIKNLTLTNGFISNPTGFSGDSGGGGLSMCGASGSRLMLLGVDITNSVSNDTGGGGLRVCQGNRAALFLVKITGNRSDTDGGGALIEGALDAQEVSIDNNQVVSKAANAKLRAGGGISFSGAATSTLDFVGITNNSSDVPNGIGGGLAVLMMQSSTLHLFDTRIEGNSTSTSHGGGVGISGGVVEMTNVSASENRALQGDGGGIYLATETVGSSLMLGQMSARQLVVSANRATNGGGIGVSASNVAPSSLVHGTVAFNLVTGNGGGLGPNAGNGSAFPGSSSFPFHSNLVAENVVIGTSATQTTRSACATPFSHSGNSSGYNLSDDSTCGFTQSTDQQMVDAGLLNLADKAGPFRSIPLVANSPAIDRAHPTMDANGNDARAAPVTDGNEDGLLRRDIGAYEFGGFGAITLTTATATGNEATSLNVQARRYGDLRSQSTAVVATADTGTGVGFALANSDYRSTRSTLIWNEGDSSTKTVTVPLLGDAQIEPDETFRVLIESASRGVDFGLISSNGVTIKDVAGSGSAGGGSTGGSSGGGGTGSGSGSGGTGTGGTGGTTPVNSGGSADNGSSGGGGGGAMGWSLLAALGFMGRARRRPKR